MTISGTADFIVNGQRYATAAPCEIDTAIAEFDPKVDHINGQIATFVQKERKAPTVEVDLFDTSEQDIHTIATGSDLVVSVRVPSKSGAYIFTKARCISGHKLMFAEGKAKLTFAGNLEIPTS